MYTLGGFSPDQFADNRKPFTREELDQALPNNPVLLQFTRVETYLNSKAIDAIGLEKMTEPWIKRDAQGRATGVVDDPGAGAVRNAAGFLRKRYAKEIFETSQMAMLKDFQRAGLTASGGGCQYEDQYREWQKQGRLSHAILLLPDRQRSRRRPGPDAGADGRQDHRRRSRSSSTTTATSGSTT